MVLSWLDFMYNDNKESNTGINKIQNRGYTIDNDNRGVDSFKGEFNTTVTKFSDLKFVALLLELQLFYYFLNEWDNRAEALHYRK